MHAQTDLHSHACKQRGYSFKLSLVFLNLPEASFYYTAVLLMAAEPYHECIWSVSFKWKIWRYFFGRHYKLCFIDLSYLCIFCVYVYFYRINSKMYTVFGLSRRFYSLRLLLVSLNFSILLCPSIVYLKSHLGHWSLLDMWVYLGWGQGIYKEWRVAYTSTIWYFWFCLQAINLMSYIGEVR